jgi:hypothetical protein
VELSHLLYNASQSLDKKLVIVEGAVQGYILDKPEEVALYKQFIHAIK